VAESVALVVFLAEDQGVVGVGGHALEAVREQFLQAGDVGAERFQTALDGHGLALPDQFVEVSRRLEYCRAGQDFGRLVLGTASSLVAHPHGVPALGNHVNDALQPGRVEVDVRHGGEQGLDNGHGGLVVPDAQGAAAVGVHAQAFGQVD